MTLYSLIGTRLGHSFSAGYFNSRFEKEGIGAIYFPHEMPDLAGLEKWIAETPELAGFNVTIPFKTQIIPLLDALSPLAEEVGAVNTVRIIRDVTVRRGFRLEGFNTDVRGFMELMSRARIDPVVSSLPQSHPQDRAEALVLGSGGASKAVVAALKNAGFKPKVVSRSDRGDVRYSGLKPEDIHNAAVIVQATPLGMWPNISSAPPIGYEYLKGAGQVCLDLVYNPEETLFMKICAAHGAKVAGGLAMLHAQADAAWSIWNLPMAVQYQADQGNDNKPSPDHP